MKTMEIKMKFKPNPEYRLMDQVREVLRYYPKRSECVPVRVR